MLIELCPRCKKQVVESFDRGYIKLESYHKEGTKSGFSNHPKTSSNGTHCTSCTDKALEVLKEAGFVFDVWTY